MDDDATASSGTAPGSERDGGSREAEILAGRRESMVRLERAGMPPFALTLRHALGVDDRPRRPMSGGAHPDLDADTTTEDVVTVAGRVVLKRDIGKLKFLVVRDRTGDLQVVASESDLPDRLFSLLDEVDLGDIIAVTGRVGTTRRGSSACSPSGGRCSRRPAAAAREMARAAGP